jgi:hypothetical protein
MEKKPTYRTWTTIKDGILEIVLIGEITEDSAGKLWNQFFTLVSSINIKYLLVDIRALKGRFGYIGKAIRSRKNLSFRPKLRNAFVDIPENAEHARFLEDSTNSVGMNLKCFTDINAARTWLKSKPSLKSYQ